MQSRCCYPQPNTNKPSLKGKLEYFDRCKRDGKSKVDGKEWMDKDIIRAVNQGIGRVIRHKDDYGMIFMLDEGTPGQNTRRIKQVGP